MIFKPRLKEEEKHKWSRGIKNTLIVEEAARIKSPGAVTCSCPVVAVGSERHRKGRQGRGSRGALRCVMTPFFADADSRRRVVTVQVITRSLWC